MASIHVKQCAVTEGHLAWFYAEVGNTITIRAPNGSGLTRPPLRTLMVTE